MTTMYLTGMICGVSISTAIVWYYKTYGGICS